MKKRRKTIWETTGSKVKIPLPLAAFVVGLAVFSLYLAVELTTEGSQLRHLEEAEKRALNEKRLLSEELARNSSLTLLKDKAQELGFDKPLSIVYLGKTEPVAKLP